MELTIPVFCITNTKGCLIENSVWFDWYNTSIIPSHKYNWKQNIYIQLYFSTSRNKHWFTSLDYYNNESGVLRMRFGHSSKTSFEPINMHARKAHFNRNYRQLTIIVVTNNNFVKPINENLPFKTKMM